MGKGLRADTIKGKNISLYTTHNKVKIYKDSDKDIFLTIIDGVIRTSKYGATVRKLIDQNIKFKEIIDVQ